MRARIYTRDHCLFCALAKAALVERGFEIEEIDLGPNRRPDAIQRFSVDAKGAKTVPQVLIDGRLIGGWEALSAHLDALTETREGEA